MPNYMKIGSRARKQIRKEDKKGTAAAKAERLVHLEFGQRLRHVQATLRQTSQGTLGDVAIHVHATDSGYAVHVQTEGQNPICNHVRQQGSVWANTLDALIAAVEPVAPAAGVTFILSDPELTSRINPEQLERWEGEGWQKPGTLQPRPNAEKWQRLNQLLKRHHYVAKSDAEMKSPRVKELRKLLKNSQGG